MGKVMESHGVLKTQESRNLGSSGVDNFCLSMDLFPYLAGNHALELLGWTFILSTFKHILCFSIIRNLKL